MRKRTENLLDRERLLKDIAREVTDESIQIHENSDNYFNFFYSRNGRFPAFFRVYPEKDMIRINNQEYRDVAEELSLKYSVLTKKYWHLEIGHF